MDRRRHASRHSDRRPESAAARTGRRSPRQSAIVGNVNTSRVVTWTELTGTGDHLNGRHRVAAKLEEVVFDAHDLAAEDRRPDHRERKFDIVPRSDVTRRPNGWRSGGQGPAIDPAILRGSSACIRQGSPTEAKMLRQAGPQVQTRTIHRRATIRHHMRASRWPDAPLAGDNAPSRTPGH